MQKAVNAEAKAGLKSIIIVQDLDICCPQGHRPSSSTVLKVQTKKTIAKNFSYPKKPKTKEIKFIYANAAKFSKSAKKEDKQKRLKRWRKRIKKPKKTPATSNNAINVFKVNLKKKYNTSKVMCLNYNKKGHYASNCTKSPKT